MKDLIERLEKATGPDRELDLAIHIVDSQCDPTSTYNKEHDCLEWFEYHPEVPGGASELLADPLPLYTGSLDAALTLVPAGVSWQVTNGNDGAFYSFVDKTEYQKGTTPAIALCIAALKAQGVLKEKGTAT